MKLTQNDTKIVGGHDSCGVVFIKRDCTKTVPMKSKEDYICAGCGAPTDVLGYCTNGCDDYPVEEDD